MERANIERSREQLANEMEQYKMTVFAVTETHLTETGQIVIDKMKGYRMLLSRRQDGRQLKDLDWPLTPMHLLP